MDFVALTWRTLNNNPAHHLTSNKTKAATDKIFPLGGIPCGSVTTSPFPPPSPALTLGRQCTETIPILEKRK